jgi:hypothetical protein
MYKLQKRDEARRLFVEADLTYEEISRALKVSEAGLKNWGKTHDWKRARGEYQHSLESLDTTLAQAGQLIAAKLVNVFNGAEPFDSQVVYATVKAGVLLLLLQADRGKGNSKAVLELLEALNMNDERVRRVVKRLAG